MRNKPKSRKNTKPRVVQIHSKTSKLRHFQLVHHKHSGKVISHHHTSYLGLAIILAILGIVIFFSQKVWGSPISVQHNVGVTALVTGAPPTSGAVIMSPTDGTVFTDQTTVVVNGTCNIDTSVVISNGGGVIGSTNCLADGTFILNVQLDYGQNVLSARNFNFANQYGPDTADVTVTLTASTPPATPVATNAPIASPEPTTEPQAVVPKDSSPYAVEQSADQNPCDNQPTPLLPRAIKPKVAVTCIPRIFKPNIQYSIQVSVWGGTAPYAVDVDWGTSSIPHTLVSLASTGYKTIPITYAVAGSYSIKINVRDSSGYPAYVQTAATVPGDSSPIAAVTNAITHASWFNTPVPVYTTAVTLTLGFWASQAFTHFTTNPLSHVAQHIRRPRKLVKR